MADHSDSPGGVNPLQPTKVQPKRLSTPDRKHTSLMYANHTPKSMDSDRPLNTRGSQTLTPRSESSSYHNKNPDSSVAGAGSSRRATGFGRFSSPKHRRGAMPTADHFISPDLDSTPIAKKSGRYRHGDMHTADNSAFPDTIAPGDESPFTANAMGRQSTVGRTGFMTYAAVLASNSPSKSLDIEKREDKSLRTNYGELEHDDAAVQVNFENRQPSTSHVRRQQPDQGKDADLESKGASGRRSRNARTTAQRRKRAARSSELQDFSKSYPKTGHTQANHPTDGPILNSEARVPSSLPESQQSSKPTLREVPTNVRKCNSVASIEEFAKRYPKTGRTEIEELRTELEQLPHGSQEGHNKLRSLIAKCDGRISNELRFLSEKIKMGNKSASEEERLRNGTCEAIRGFEERKSRLVALLEEYTARNSEKRSLPTASGEDHTGRTSEERRSPPVASEEGHTTKNNEERISLSTASEEDYITRNSADSFSGSFVTATEGSAMSFRTAMSDGTANRENVLRQSEAGPTRDESADSSTWTTVSKGGKGWKGKEKAADEASEEQPRNNEEHRQQKTSHLLDTQIRTHANHPVNSTQRKALNFDSPAFTPAAANGTSRSNHPTLSSQAAAAAPFTPRALSAATTPNPQQRESDPISSLNVARIPEFTPSYDMTPTVNQPAANGTAADASLQFDPFSMSSVAHAMPSTPFNPYMEDNNGLAADPMSSYYPTQNNYVPATQPLQYHLYAPQGPSRDDLLPYQRQVHEFFIPEKLRESFQRRAEATLQVMPHSQLPVVDPYHSLVALDTNQHQNTQLFGYPSWIYKGLSQKTGHYYCLRRLEGYRATNDRAIRCVKDWRRVDGTHVVKIHDAFTTRAFGDSSLVIVTDYHPLSKTLAEHHFASRNRAVTNVHESVLWSYIVQISLALKEIHQSNLAARCIDPSKVILTDKNRIRLNACAVLDVVEFEFARPLIELQQEDFFKFGKLILSIATHIPLAQLPSQAALDQLTRDYSTELVEVIRWLIQTPSTTPKTIPTLFSLISYHTADVLSKLYSAQDTYTTEFFKELENSRLTRLTIKLNMINERPEFAHNPDWAETGDRYVLKLMRDYIFHQVDAEGRANVDLGWVVGCLNKLDVGSAELVELVSRDGNTVFVVSWKEVKSVIARTWAELCGGGSGNGGGGSGGNGNGNGGGSGSRRR